MDDSLKIDVTIHRTVLRGASPPFRQTIASVSINGTIYHVSAPPDAKGNAVDWIEDFRVRKWLGWNREEEVYDSYSNLALRLAKEEIERRRPEPAQVDRGQKMPVNSEMDVFISHSSRDVDIAEALINLLRAAIPALRPEVIRCTSVPGYRLGGGAKTDEQIPKELRGAKVFIGLVSEQSLQSTYVLFELGARWGAGQHLLPLAVAGMNPSEFKAPLSGLNTHSASVESHLFQLVDEVGTILGLPLAKTPVYSDHVKRLVQISEALGAERQGGVIFTSSQPVRDNPEPAAVSPTPRNELIADLISELQDNVEAARARRVGDAYLRPATNVWKQSRNRIKLADPLRSDLTQAYREIEHWRTIVDSGVHPNMGNPALDNTTASLSGRLPTLIEELKKLFENR